MQHAVQRSFDDLGLALFDVPFCVLDLETTGGSATHSAITEIGAVRYERGVLEGTFQSLVNPGSPIPPFITVLTGITHAMVVEAPGIEETYPSLLEFIGDAVVVGHNVRFDLSFLNAAGERLGYGRLPNRSVDTAALARRLVRGEVRNLKLSTLARHFRSPTTPNHRALEDARATAHVLFALLERAGSLGVTHLEDLLQLPTARGSTHYGKIALTEHLPRSPGVYLFKDRNGEVFYIGKAKNLRSRVRSYFYGDTRRSVSDMLRELHVIEHRPCETELEAMVTELRLIWAHRPRHNRRSKPPKASHWVTLTSESFPRLTIVRSPKLDGRVHLGPFRSRRSATQVVEAIWDGSRIRRCSGRPGSRSARCAFAQLGTALCPCAGDLDETVYAAEVESVVTGLTHNPELLLDVLTARIARLAAERRFEEAAWVRDRRAALARAIERRRRWISLQFAGTMRLAGPDGDGALIDRGTLVAAWPDGSRPPLIAAADPADAPDETPLAPVDAEEAQIIWAWLDRDGIDLIDITGSLATPSRPVPALDHIAI